MSWLPDWITDFDRTAYEEGLEADRKNRELTEDLRRRGLISQENYDIAARHYEESLGYDPDAAIADSFEEGFYEGADNIRNFAGDTINTVVGTPLRLIPWQVWLAGAIYLGWRLGLFNGLLKPAK